MTYSQFVVLESRSLELVRVLSISRLVQRKRDILLNDAQDLLHRVRHVADVELNLRHRLS